MHVTRVVSERDSLKSEIQSLRINSLSMETELNQANSVLGNVKSQVAYCHVYPMVNHCTFDIVKEETSIK